MGRHKSRGNRQGTAILSPNGKSWTAIVTIGHKVVGDKIQTIRRKKSGYPTKRAALEACALLLDQSIMSPVKKPHYTLQEVYEMWESYYTPRVDPSTMTCYISAYKHFKVLHNIYIDAIQPEQLQECLDACSLGKRTHQNMKVTAGLIWKYAVDHKVVERDITRNLFIGRHESKQRDPLSDDEVELFHNAIGQTRYAEYVYCLCYLGFRPGELLELKKEAYHTQVINGQTVHYLIGGKKTQAGRNRAVVIPSQILDIVLDRLFIPGTDLLFPQYVFIHPKKEPERFVEFKQMSDAYLRNSVFKKLADKYGIEKGKVPYSARHTYADKLEKAEGSDRNKAALIGHADYKFTQQKYQSKDLADLNAVVSTIK